MTYTPICRNNPLFWGGKLQSAGRANHRHLFQHWNRKPATLEFSPSDCQSRNLTWINSRFEKNKTNNFQT
jgi:hypothetical protein